MGLDQSHSAFIAIGGNLGDVKKTFIHARSALNAQPDIEVGECSKLYQTPPLGPAGQPDYLNAVIAIKTTLKPHSLLQRLQQLEDQHGRIRAVRWGARTLDLDILSYDDIHIQTEALTIPHAMLCERMFVLYPLCDIDPNWQHPLLKVSAQQLMEHLIAKGEPPLPEGEVW